MHNISAAKKNITIEPSIAHTKNSSLDDTLKFLLTENNKFKVRESTIESRNYISPIQGYDVELYANMDEPSAHITISKWGNIEEHYYLEDGKLDSVYIYKEDKEYGYDASELEKDNPKPKIKDRY